MKKILATLFLTIGLSGVLAAAAPAASADVCILRLNVTIFGNHIGSGRDCTLPPG